MTARGALLKAGGWRGTAGETRAVWLCLTIIGAIYFVRAADFASFHAFWSPDSGARFAMVRGLIENGDPVHVRYAARQVDPEGRIHPLSRMHVVNTPRGLSIIYSPILPILAAPLYRLFGFPGLALVPLLAGLAACWLTYAAARCLGIGGRLALVPLMALATPLAVYSVVFWDHALLVCVAAAALYSAARSAEPSPGRWPVVCGAVLGVGIWLHGLGLALAVAAVAALAMAARDSRGRRMLGGVAVGLLPLAALWVAGNLWLYGLPGGAHLLGTAKFAASAGAPEGTPISRFSSKAAMQTLGGGLLDLKAAGLALCLLLAALTARLPGRWRALAVGPWLAGALFAWQMAAITNWVHGLFQATPLLIPAFTGFAADSDDGSATLRWAGWTSLFYGLLVFASPGSPDLDWGGRFLLTTLPLLIVLAAAGFDSVWRAGKAAGRSLAVAAAAALALISLLSQQRALALVQGDLAYSREVNLAVSAAGAPLLATDVWWVGPETTPVEPEKLFVRDTPADRATFFCYLDRSRTKRFVFYGGVPALARIEQEAEAHQPAYVCRGCRNAAGWQMATFERSDPALEPTGVARWQ